MDGLRIKQMLTHAREMVLANAQGMWGFKTASAGRPLPPMNMSQIEGQNLLKKVTTGVATQKMIEQLKQIRAETNPLPLILGSTTKSSRNRNTQESWTTNIHTQERTETTV